jgi:hypothetical protein
MLCDPSVPTMLSRDAPSMLTLSEEDCRRVSERARTDKIDQPLVNDLIGRR